MNISIIGAGSMGSGIAQVAATADCKVKIFDTNPAVLETADKKLRKILARLVEKGRIDEAKQNSILGNIKYITVVNSRN